MFRKFFVALILLLWVAMPATAADKIRLLEISNIEDPKSDKIWLGFSKKPAYVVKTSGRKVELFLPGVAMSPVVQELPGYGSIVSYYVLTNDAGISLTFVLARKPVKVDSFWGNRSSEFGVSDRDHASPEGLELDIRWSEKLSVIRPTIAFSLLGAQTARSDAVSSLSLVSPYKGQWKSFFADYESLPKLFIPLHYSIPPFPFLGVETAEQEHHELVTAIEYGKKSEWQDSLTVLRKVLGEQQPEGKKYAELLLGEALIRSGAFEEGVKILSKWLKKHSASSEENYVNYLIIFAKASSGNMYNSVYELAELLRSHNLGGILPYCRLLQAELFLATEQADKALSILKGNEEIYKDLSKSIYFIRLADALASTGSYDSALQNYQKLQDSGEMVSLLADRFFSRGCLAYTLYQSKAYSSSIKHYNVLNANLGHMPVQQGLVLYFLAVAQQKSGKKDVALLDDIVANFPGTEAYYRALLKQSDWEISSLDETNRNHALLQYKELAVNTPFRGVREEAAFKVALVNCLTGEQVRCVEQLQVFLRNYSRGSLRRHAEALLVEFLPAVSNELVGQGEYLKTLVLAEQSRDLLLGGQLSDSFLNELAVSFSRLGFWGRAARVYRFLLEVSRGTNQEESRYLPLITVYYEKGDYENVEEYAKKYAAHFQDGNDFAPVYFLRIHALYKSGQLQKAVDLLKQAQITEPKLDMLAGRIFWELREYDKVEKYLARAMNDDLRNTTSLEIFIRAESLFKSSNEDQAMPLYNHLFADEIYGDRALYRAAQVHFREGRDADGLKLLQRLVEEANDISWRRMAEENIAINRL